ncbi:ficolin-2-like [Acanthaster planci]|uniref:Ficolin-2-like n=1 Tax=Acanthaster planci TaxID=133434 RepID=A0A8B7ZPC6_ACAPL|nr:ficolin-2-like [Acanthaster planci]
MASFRQTLVVAFIMFGVFTAITASDDPTGSREAQQVRWQQNGNPLDGSAYCGTACNCTTVQEIVSNELQSTTTRLVQLERNIASKVDDVSTELNDMKLQLDQLKGSVRELAELLRNKSVIPPLHPKDCSEAFANGETTSGVYTVQPADEKEPFSVYCDMDTDGGGWTVFQRRQDGSVDFYRDWESYRQGFGDLNGEFWLGNDNLHRLTAQGEYRLRVDLEDFGDNTRYAEYDTFRVASGRENYQLTVGGYTGTAGDSLSYQNNLPFTTKDRDNGPAGFNCASEYFGAWWYAAGCHVSNLNGLYLSGQTFQLGLGVVWADWRGHYYSLKRTEMKIKAASN